MKPEKFFDLMNEYTTELIKGESKKILKLKYYEQFKELDKVQFETLMFHDFIINNFLSIFQRAIDPKHKDTEICNQIINCMQKCWFARANFHEFCKRNDDIDLKKTIDVCLN